MAAAYLCHLCQNHAFMDGNKRVGTNAAITLLLMNEWDATFSDEELVDVVLSVASGRLGKEALTKRTEINFAALMRVLATDGWIALGALRLTAQVDLAGEWGSKYTWDYQDRLPGPELGGYTATCFAICRAQLRGLLHASDRRCVGSGEG